MSEKKSDLSTELQIESGLIEFSKTEGHFKVITGISA